MNSRVLTAAVGLVASLAISAVLWLYFETLLVFLFLPFVPFLFRSSSDSEDRPQVRTCPRCDFQTVDDEYEYCPRDGRRLTEPGSRTTDDTGERS